MDSKHVNNKERTQYFEATELSFDSDSDSIIVELFEEDNDNGEEIVKQDRNKGFQFFDKTLWQVYNN